MDDLTYFYLKRKAQIDDMKRRQNSLLKQKTLNILSKEAEEIVVEKIESELNNNYSTSFEDRFNQYIEEIEKWRNK